LEDDVGGIKIIPERSDPSLRGITTGFNAGTGVINLPTGGISGIYVIPVENRIQMRAGRPASIRNR